MPMPLPVTLTMLGSSSGKTAYCEDDERPCPARLVFFLLLLALLRDGLLALGALLEGGLLDQPDDGGVRGGADEGLDEVLHGVGLTTDGHLWRT